MNHQLPTPAILYCPACESQHIDKDEWATRPHRTHLCAICGNEWRPSARATVGVRDMPVAVVHDTALYHSELTRKERIDHAMANKAVDRVVAGEITDPYKKWCSEDRGPGGDQELRPVRANPALGAPYITEQEIAEAQAIKDKVLQQITDALRWRALMACERIRVIGTGSLGEKHAHISLEIWGLYPKLDEEDRRNVAAACATLTKFIDGIRG